MSTAEKTFTCARCGEDRPVSERNEIEFTDATPQRTFGGGTETRLYCNRCFRRLTGVDPATLN